KNASLERIEWRYPEDEAREHGLEAAIAKGKARAERVAAALGVKLLGVYDFMENTFDEERPPMPFQARAMEMQALGAADQPSLNMDIQHSKMINVNVEIWYRVSSL
ncbi:MAG TPA: SIMPL domain-containing protein, partial [Anaerolineales bacterium]